MSMYNLLEYADGYSKTSGSLWQYKVLMVRLLIFLLITIIVLLSNLNNK